MNAVTVCKHLCFALFATFLSACGGGDPAASAQIRLVNATASGLTLDLVVNDVLQSKATAYGKASPYATVASDNSKIRVVNSANGATVIGTTLNFKSGAKYALIAYGPPAVPKGLFVQENLEPADSGKSKVNFLNLGDSAPIDVYLTAVNDSLDKATPLGKNINLASASGYQTVTSGNMRLRVTVANSKKEIRFDQTLTLASGSTANIALNVASSGLLMNAVLIPQGGEPSAIQNLSSRIRVVSGIGKSAAVSVMLGTDKLLPASLSPTITDYTPVIASGGPAVVSVNGVFFQLPMPAVAPGADYTLLLWGSPSAPQLAALADDNSASADTTLAAMRVYNGLNAPGAGITLSLDFKALVTNVVAGGVSPMVDAKPGPSSLLVVSAPTLGLPGPLYSAANLPVQAGSLYSVFVLGETGAAVGVIKKDR